MAAKDIDPDRAKKLKQEAEMQIGRILWQYYLDTGLWPVNVNVEQLDSYAPTEAFQAYKIRIDVTIP